MAFYRHTGTEASQNKIKKKFAIMKENYQSKIMHSMKTRFITMIQFITSSSAWHLLSGATKCFIEVQENKD